MRARPRVPLLLVSCVLSAPLLAAVKLPPLFADGMVVQSDRPCPIWGWAAAGEVVSVESAGTRSETKADANGRWRAEIAPLKAGGPHEIKVRGKNEIVLRDVLAGEVWLASGQSNMAWRIKQLPDAAEVIAATDLPQVRAFNVSTTGADSPQESCAGEWIACTGTATSGFSATAFFFAKKLHEELRVPVGILNASVGGSPIEAWIPPATLDAIPEGVAARQRHADAIALLPTRQAEFPSKEAEWTAAAEKAKAQGKEPPQAPRPPMKPHPPGGFFDGMIHPLIPYPIRGAIWYQGESNTGAPEAYPKLFAAMLFAWRARWGGDFPVGFVQLTRYKARSQEPQDTMWARFREAQAKCLDIPGTAMAVMIDGGDEEDTHPPNKREAGTRLALPMLASVYGRKHVVWSGPTFKGMQKEDGALRLSFSNVHGGLVGRGGTLRGFAVADKNRQFFWATAVLEAASVVVRAEQVPEPEAVRYAWADFPEGNLFNGAGLPAPPFRSDDWRFEPPTP